jgi:hypothetical protein
MHYVMYQIIFKFEFTRSLVSFFAKESILSKQIDISKSSEEVLLQNSNRFVGIFGNVLIEE